VNAKKCPLFASLLLAFLLSGHALAHEMHHAPGDPVITMAAGQHDDMAPVAARYELTVNKRHAKTQTDWYLWRDADSVETASVAVGHNDIWQRLGADEYHYRRVFHHEKRVIDYTPGEIKTRHAEPDWRKLASVISPHLLEELKRGPSTTMFGEKAVRYTGKVGDQEIDLWWLVRTKVPASLKMTRQGERMTLALREIHAKAPTAWPRVSDDGIADYGMIDAADFGDMESDPFVAHVMQQDGHGHSH